MKRFLSGIMIGLLSVAVFSGCGAAPPQAAEEYQSASSADYAPPAEEYAASTYDYEEGEQGGYMSPLPLLTPTNDQGKKMVYTVELALQTTAFEEGARNLLTVVAEKGGYIQNAHIYGHSLYQPEVDRRATYTFGIPSENLAEFLAIMEQNYNLWELVQESQDITARYERIDTRLTDLQEQEVRLQAAIEAAVDENETALLESELSNVQAEISKLGASKGAMDSDVIYSTVSIQLFEVTLYNSEEIPVDSFGTRLNRTTGNSIGGFVAFWQGVLVFLIEALPAVVVIAIFVAVGLLIVRVWRKKVRKATGALTGREEDSEDTPRVDDSIQDEPEE